jgi:tetratricopeptide (TPR) repeat protein
LKELSQDEFSSLNFDLEWLLGMSLLAESAVLIGDADSAPTLYRLLTPWERMNVADIPEAIRGSVSRYLGLLAAALERWDEANQHFEKALEANKRMGLRPWLARTQEDFARMLHKRGKRDDAERAHQLLGAAHLTYRELGMESHVRAITTPVKTPR